ncbi:MAG: acetyltransferase [Acidobacteria bacterium]|nr:MAG: acetyltransferase [Acidobacteriota bacterium]
MFAVPFENLDISLGRNIICDENRFLRKIVEEKRGGFCYEMNGAFAALLRALGFKVTLLSARVSNADGSEGPEFDHLALRVDLDEPWLVDVGFGDSFIEPLVLEPDLDQKQFGKGYRLISTGGGLCLESNANAAWKKEYLFTLQPRDLSEFETMCHYHQTSPDSPFTRKRVCSVATPAGRITVSGDRLIETCDGVRQERRLTDEERIAVLRERFGVSLS